VRNKKKIYPAGRKNLIWKAKPGIGRTVGRNPDLKEERVRRLISSFIKTLRRTSRGQTLITWKFRNRRELAKNFHQVRNGRTNTREGFGERGYGNRE